MDDTGLHAGIAKAIAGVAGSFVSMLFVKDTWPRKIAMFAAGSITAWFCAGWLARHTSLDEGVSGFLIGLFSMVVVAKVIDTWQQFDVGKLVGDWARKMLGLPAKEG